jgi:ubiquitin carboxyl-terminal hydrolase 9/24
MLLDGHLSITKELLQFQSADKKHLVGCHPQGAQLINDLIEYFIFPASCLFKKYRDALLAVSNMRQQASSSSSSPSTINSETLSALNNVEQMLASKSLKSICSSSMTTSSAFDLLVALSNGCLPNFLTLSDMLFNLFYPSLIATRHQQQLLQQLQQQQQQSMEFCATRFVVFSSLIYLLYAH